MAFHVQHEETLGSDALAALQQDKLSRLVESLRESNPFYRRKLAEAGFHSGQVELSRLPFTTRPEVEADQAHVPPYGSNLTFELNRYTRLHGTSGSMGTPVRWLDTPESWAWCRRCWAIVYRAAGIRAEDRLMFPFSFGPFIGFWLAFETADELGLFHIAAGGMTTPARLRMILDNGITTVCCTPTYALHMAEVAAKERIELAASTVRKLIVAGEPGGNIPTVRRRIEEAWGARVFDHAGMTEIGAWGFECEEAPGGMHVIESEFIAEVIDPVTLSPAPPGVAGELVLTNLGRTGSPLIRYRTGDQVRLARGRCVCGRSFARAEGGVLGRIDDMLVIRGNNVFPSAVEAVLREFQAVAEFRLRPILRGGMTELVIEVELAEGEPEAPWSQRLVEAVRNRLGFRPLVEMVAATSLPRFEMKARRVVRGERP